MSGLHVRVRGLTKTFRKAGQDIHVLDQVDLELQRGEKVAIVGPSGSGKSTFLHLLGLLDRPSSGEVYLDDQDIGSMNSTGRSRIRNRSVGFVFQAHNLLPELSAVGNVAVACTLAGASPAVAESRARTLLRAVGLGHRLLHQPGELSGGEQQRVALARALVMGPGLVLADEPTGNLDPTTSEGVFDLMMGLNEQLGSTLVVVTHSPALAARFPRCLRLDSGRFVES